MNTMNESSGQAPLEKLVSLGLTRDESRVYIELTKAPSSHLQLSRDTGINRTKVYRVVDSLEKQGLIARRTDDTGSFLVAGDIAELEIRLAAKEERIQSQRSALQSLMPDLIALRGESNDGFFVQTYEGEAGYKQMCWHELRAKDETLTLGNGTIEDVVSDIAWSKKHRQKQIDAGYRVLEITNFEYGVDDIGFAASEVIDSGLYKHRRLSPDILLFDGQTVIYNNTVSIYHWKHEKKVGIEIINKAYADMMRQIFWHYWDLAEDRSPFED